MAIPLEDEPSVILANSRFIAPNFMRGPGIAGTALRLTGASHVKLGSRAVDDQTGEDPERNMYGVSETHEPNGIFSAHLLTVEQGEHTTVTGYEPNTVLDVLDDAETAVQLLAGIDNPPPGPPEPPMSWPYKWCPAFDEGDPQHTFTHNGTGAEGKNGTFYLGADEPGPDWFYMLNNQTAFDYFLFIQKADIPFKLVVWANRTDTAPTIIDSIPDVSNPGKYAATFNYNGVNTGDRLYAVVTDAAATIGPAPLQVTPGTPAAFSYESLCNIQS